MSQRKRGDKDRRDGKPYLPRNSWKNEHSKPPKKKCKNKPFVIEERITNFDEIDPDDWFITLFDRSDKWKRSYQKYRRIEDATKGLLYLRKNRSTYFNIRLEYRIVDTREKAAA
jgi:hypothetical protein|tara:strand:+ start:2737 stop:3078 length:342 start_codon:yes stop_codon:yes gene_type:complete